MVIYLLGNKVDLPPEMIKITKAQAHERFVKNSNINIQVMETSAQTGQGVKELFQDLTENLYRQHLEKCS